MIGFSGGVEMDDDYNEARSGRERHFADSPKKSVFLVSSGQYSDYSIACVCSSEAVAMEVARRMSLGWQNSPQYRKPPRLNEHWVEEIEMVSDADEFVAAPTAALDPEGT